MSNTVIADLGREDADKTFENCSSPRTLISRHPATKATLGASMPGIALDQVTGPLYPDFGME